MMRPWFIIACALGCRFKVSIEDSIEKYTIITIEDLSSKKKKKTIEDLVWST